MRVTAISADPHAMQECAACNKTLHCHDESKIIWWRTLIVMYFLFLYIILILTYFLTWIELVVVHFVYRCCRVWPRGNWKRPNNKNVAEWPRSGETKNNLKVYNCRNLPAIFFEWTTLNISSSYRLSRALAAFSR